MGIYERTHEFLDEDERMITRDMYHENPWVYDAVKGTVALYRHRERGDIDWIFNNKTPCIDAVNWEFLGDFIIVRVLENTGCGMPDLITPEQLEANRDRYVILEVYLRVQSNKYPYKTSFLTEKPEDMEGYSVVGVMYKVRYKSFEDIDYV